MCTYMCMYICVYNSETLKKYLYLVHFAPIHQVFVMVQQLQRTGLGFALKERVPGLKMFTTWWGLLAWGSPWPNQEYGELGGGGVKEVRDIKGRECHLQVWKASSGDDIWEGRWMVASWQPAVMREDTAGVRNPTENTKNVQGPGRGQFGWSAGCISREIAEGKARKAGWARPQRPCLSWWWRPHGATEGCYGRAGEEVDRRTMRRLYPSQEPKAGQLQQPRGKARTRAQNQHSSNRRLLTLLSMMSCQEI